MQLIFRTTTPFQVRHTIIVSNAVQVIDLGGVKGRRAKKGQCYQVMSPYTGLTLGSIAQAYAHVAGLYRTCQKAVLGRTPKPSLTSNAPQIGNAIQAFKTLNRNWKPYFATDFIGGKVVVSHSFYSLVVKSVARAANGLILRLRPVLILPRLLAERAG